MRPTSLTWLPTLLRIASGLYLATSRFACGKQRTRCLHRRKGRSACVGCLSATLLNPKAILFGGHDFPGAAFESLGAYLEAMTIFTAL